MYTSRMIKYICKIFMYTWQITMYACKTIIYARKVIIYTCKIIIHRWLHVFFSYTAKSFHAIKKKICSDVGHRNKELVGDRVCNSYTKIKSLSGLLMFGHMFQLETANGNLEGGLSTQMRRRNALAYALAALAPSEGERSDTQAVRMIMKQVAPPQLWQFYSSYGLSGSKKPAVTTKLSNLYRAIKFAAVQKTKLSDTRFAKAISEVLKNCQSTKSCKDYREKHPREIIRVTKSDSFSKNPAARVQPPRAASDSPNYRAHTLGVSEEELTPLSVERALAIEALQGDNDRDEDFEP